jgi:tRNA threonylcarbamoyladenosine biosynthesis protein TsaB
MKILALETSTLMGSIAVVDDGRLLCELTLHVKETHSSQLMPAVDYVLKTVGLPPERLDGFAVALGPGSFTGLRIGMSTIKGLALAASKPLVGISTLEAMAWSFPFCSDLICPMIDARMKEVYAAWFAARAGIVSRRSEDMVLSVSELLQDAKEEALFFGSGAEKYRAEINGIMGKRAHFVSPEIVGARASILGFLAVDKLKRKEFADIDSLEPLYIRESQAIEKSRKRVSGG